jgi:hypothetical protein
MKRHVLTIRPDGTVSCLYPDKLPLRALGPLTVERASTVEWDDSGKAGASASPTARTSASSRAARTRSRTRSP